MPVHQSVADVESKTESCFLNKVLALLEAEHLQCPGDRDALLTARTVSRLGLISIPEFESTGQGFLFFSNKHCLFSCLPLDVLVEMFTFINMKEVTLCEANQTFL